MRHVLTLGVLLTLSLVAAADEAAKKEPAAADLLAGGIAKAKQQEKTVFLLFGSPG